MKYIFRGFYVSAECNMTALFCAGTCRANALTSSEVLFSFMTELLRTKTFPFPFPPFPPSNLYCFDILNMRNNVIAKEMQYFSPIGRSVSYLLSPSLKTCYED